MRIMYWCRLRFKKNSEVIAFYNPPPLSWERGIRGGEVDLIWGLTSLIPGEDPAKPKEIWFF
jgi:hypothetical protein